MPKCNQCGMTYSSIDGCPFCSSEETFIPNPNDTDGNANQSGTFQMDFDPQQSQQLIDPNDPRSNEPIPISEPYSYEPRNYIICPNINCLEKNPRTNSHCKKCGTSLPIHDSRLENRTQDQRISQLIDPRVQEKYFRVAMHLFIAKLIGKENKMKCNNFLPDGTQCQEILTPLNKECPNPQCKRKHAYYPCINCGMMIPISTMSCRCGSPSYLSDAIAVIKGGGMGEGADHIINDFQSVFNIELRKQAISSFANQQDIIYSKFRLESITRQLKSTFDLLADYLSDFMSPNKKSQMSDAFSVMYQNTQNDQNAQNGILQINQIGAPIPSDRIRSIVADREREIREASQRNTDDPPDPNDVQTMMPPQTNSPPLQTNDRGNDPWGDVNI